jgi:hypothetical protein
MGYLISTFVHRCTKCKNESMFTPHFNVTAYNKHFNCDDVGVLWLSNAKFTSMAGNFVPDHSLPRKHFHDLYKGS